MSSPWGTPAFSMIGAPGATGSTGELGPTGPTGGPGIAIYNGAEIPANTGAQGDYFINTNREIYQYSGGGWTGLFSPEAYISSIKTSEIMTVASEFQSTITISTMSTYTSTIMYTGFVETFEIPQLALSSITFQIIGAGGANLGGAGSHIIGTYDCQVGDSNFGIYVGQGGQLTGTALGAQFIGSNYNFANSGGGIGTSQDSNSVGGGGGGASAIVFPNGSNVIIAGGGGGGYSFGEFVYQGGAGGLTFGFEPSVPSLRLLLRASTYSGEGVWLDESGNDKNAILFTGTDSKNANGNGIILDGSTAWEVSPLDLGSVWTLEALYKQNPDSNSSVNASIITPFALGNTGDLGIIYLGNITTSHTIRAGFFAEGGFRQSPGVSLGTSFTHYAATWDGSTLTFYKNAIIENTTQIEFTAEDRGYQYLIGRNYQQADSFMNGEIAEIRAYNYAIGQAKVTADYNESLATMASLSVISGFLGSNVTDTGFTISWSGGRGTGVTTTFTLNGTAATPSSSSTGTASFTGLTPETEYVIQVIATNSGGSVSSRYILTTIATVVDPPTAITGLTESGVSSSGFTVTWSGGTGTEVTTTFTLDGTAATPSSSGTGTATFTGLSAETAYLVVVLAGNSGGSVDSSITVTTTA